MSVVELIYIFIKHCNAWISAVYTGVLQSCVRCKHFVGISVLVQLKARSEWTDNAENYHRLLLFSEVDDVIFVHVVPKVSTLMLSVCWSGHIMSSSQNFIEVSGLFAHILSVTYQPSSWSAVFMIVSVFLLLLVNINYAACLPLYSLYSIKWPVACGAECIF